MIQTGKLSSEGWIHALKARLDLQLYFVFGEQSTMRIGAKQGSESTRADNQFAKMGIHLLRICV